MRKLVALQSAGQGDARVGSISVAAWIARVGFLTLITIGIWSGDLRRRGATIFIVLGLAVWLGLPELPSGADFVTSGLAILDIALVFAIFKGDVRIW